MPFAALQACGVLVVALAVSLFVAGSFDEPSGIPMPEQIVDEYRSYNRMTNEPHEVSLADAQLCAAAPDTPAHEEPIYGSDEYADSPHAHAAIQIYMNDAAAEAFRSMAATYPVGSIIVKEKWHSPESTDLDPGEAEGELRGLGGMVKLPTGGEPDLGVWGYFYLDRTSSNPVGFVQSCVHCHGQAHKTDRVFGNWAK
jgi:hypothetical protein